MKNIVAYETYKVDGQWWWKRITVEAHGPFDDHADAKDAACAAQMVAEAENKPTVLGAG